MVAHEFIVKPDIWYVSGCSSRILAFLSLVPTPVTSSWRSAWEDYFPHDCAEDLQVVVQRHATHVKELGKLAVRRKAIRRTLSSPPQPNPNPEPNPLTGVAKARHEGILSHSQLRMVNRLVPGGLGWSTATLRLEEALLIPHVDRREGNQRLLVDICILLLQHAGKLIHCRKTPPAPEVTLDVFLYVDGYTPRGTSNYNSKVCLVDAAGALFANASAVPTTTELLSWREMPRVAWDSWQAGRIEELERLARACIKQPVQWNNQIYTCMVRFRLRYLSADHHHLWWELQNGQGCPSCDWKRSDWLARLFQTLVPFTLANHPKGKLAAFSGANQVVPLQPILHNLKGFGARICGVVGRILPTAEAYEFLCLLSSVAKRFTPADLPVESRQCAKLVRERFRDGISLTGREARVFAACAVVKGILPLPVHQLFLSYCHIIVLLYSSAELVAQVWQVRGKLHTFLALLLAEYCEAGSTRTQYAHGLTHVWDSPRLPPVCSDEGGEAGLRIPKRFAPVTNTQNLASIEETLQHELYVKFVGSVKKRSKVHMWHPTVRPIVLEQCVVLASAQWREGLLCILRAWVATPGCLVGMHVGTQSLKLASADVAPGVPNDVYCICGTCGARQKDVLRNGWVPLCLNEVEGWQLLDIPSIRPFTNRKDRRKHKRKHKLVVPMEAIVVNSDYDTDVSIGDSRTQPLRACTLAKRIVVDPEDSSDPEGDSTSSGESIDASDTDSCSSNSSSSSSRSSSSNSSSSSNRCQAHLLPKPKAKPKPKPKPQPKPALTYSRAATAAMASGVASFSKPKAKPPPNKRQRL